MKAVLLVVLLAALVGCAQALPPVTSSLEPVVIVPDPIEVRIPTLGVTSSLAPEGLLDDGTLDVPPVTQPQQAGWYRDGIKPGLPGPAVVMGHVSGRPPGATRSVPGIFARLHELQPGDEIDIGRADGSTAVFTVRSQILVSKDAFPAESVYGDTPAPELRAITCFGIFDKLTHSYKSNLVVFADLREIRASGE